VGAFLKLDYPGGPQKLATKRLQRRFGQLVKARRRDAGLSQAELAARAGLGVDMISKIESGATGARFPTIVKLAVALGVDAGELFLPAAGSVVPTASPNLISIMLMLGSLSDSDLGWAKSVLEATLRRHGEA